MTSAVPYLDQFGEGGAFNSLPRPNVYGVPTTDGRAQYSGAFGIGSMTTGLRGADNRSNPQSNFTIVDHVANATLLPTRKGHDARIFPNRHEIVFCDFESQANDFTTAERHVATCVALPAVNRAARTLAIDYANQIVAKNGSLRDLTGKLTKEAEQMIADRIKRRWRKIGSAENTTTPAATSMNFLAYAKAFEEKNVFAIRGATHLRNIWSGAHGTALEAGDYLWLVLQRFEEIVDGKQYVHFKWVPVSTRTRAKPMRVIKEAVFDTKNKKYSPKVVAYYPGYLYIGVVHSGSKKNAHVTGSSEGAVNRYLALSSSYDSTEYDKDRGQIGTIQAILDY